MRFERRLLVSMCVIVAGITGVMATGFGGIRAGLAVAAFFVAVIVVGFALISWTFKADR